VSGFTVEVFQNEYMAPGADEVHAVVTITSDGSRSGTATAGAEAVEVIVIDTSGSMDGRKIVEARRAVAAAIEQIRDGVWFAVVSGTDIARLVYPLPGLAGVENGLIVADAATRGEAIQAISRVRADGGTAISTWLDAAAALFSGKPSAIKHCLLVTDGRNEGEEAHLLDAAISRYQGGWVTDCRGVGTDWDVEELRSISSAMLGDVDIIPEPEEMAAEFSALIERAMGKAVAAVSLRLWIPQHAELRYVKQVAPTIEEMTGKATPGPNPQTKDYPTGAWGAEDRDYHVCVKVKAAGVGEEMLAARVSLVVDGEVVGQGLVKALWSEDEQLTARINPEVAHYTGQAELAVAVAEGLAARAAGDEATATVKLGRAVQLAEASGNETTTRLLAKVVEIDDAATGTVRLKREVEKVDVMALDTRSTKTVRVRPAAGG
jgi:hypothetical protein